MRKISFVLLVVLLDVLSLGVTLPVLPKLVTTLGGQGRGMTSYGVFVASWQVAHLLAAPVLGALSDRFGRRPLVCPGPVASRHGNRRQRRFGGNDRGRLRGAQRADRRAGANLADAGSADAGGYAQALRVTGRRHAEPTNVAGSGGSSRC